MIEADIKKFLNRRIPIDPLFKPLDMKIDDVLAEFDAAKARARRDRMIEMFRNAAKSGIDKTFPSFESNLGSNIFLNNHYAYSYNEARTNSFKLRISDNLATFAYLYTDAGSATYNQWRLGGAYNPTFFVSTTRTALTFPGLPADISWTTMDMSADGSIICVTSSTAANYLYVLKRNAGSNTAYSLMTVDVQPTAAATNMVMSGDGRKIFMLHTASPYLTVYESNADRTTYTRQDLSVIGITATQYVTLVRASFDGSTVALGYSQSVTTKQIDVYRIISGGVYTRVGIDKPTAATVNADFLRTDTQRGLQLSRDGNTLLAYMYRSGATTTFYPFILKFNEEAQTFAFDLVFHGNQLWRASAAFGVWTSADNRLWQMSDDGSWLFGSQFNRTTGSSGSVTHHLLVTDISGGQAQKVLSVHSHTVSSSTPGTNSYLGQTFFWVDPSLRYVWRGVTPSQTSVSGSYTNSLTGSQSGDIIVLDPELNWACDYIK